MKIEIKSLITGSVLFEGDFSSLAKALEAAVRARADLSGSDLRNSNLRNSDLSGSDLRNSNLSGSDLNGSDLRNSNLRNSNLSGSDFRNSDLRNSDFRNSDLRNSDLRNSDLSVIKYDFWAVLLYAIPEVPALRQALVEGKVNGTSYSGECACLVGTIANKRHCSINALGDLRPDSSRPAERFFLGIQIGSTPENNACAKLAVGWIDEFQKLTSAKG